MRPFLQSALAATAIFFAATAVATVPGQITYQGNLLENGVPAPGPVSLHFAIYDTAQGGTARWTEDHPTVPVANGIFTVLLGEHTPFPPALFDGAPRWIETTVNNQTLTPRELLRTVPYAFTAQAAQTGGGGSGWQLNGTNLYYLGGNVGIGTDAPAVPLDVAGDVRGRTLTTLSQPLGNGGGLADLRHDNLTFHGTYGYGVADQFVEFQSGFDPQNGGQGLLARITGYRTPEGYDTGEGKLKVTLRQGAGTVDGLTVDRAGISTGYQPLGNGTSLARLNYNGLQFPADYGYGVGEQYVQFESSFDPGVGGRGPLAKIVGYRTPEEYDSGKGRLRVDVRSGSALVNVLEVTGGKVRVNGELEAATLCATGTKNAIVPTSQGLRRLYCDESTSPWFADRGEGELVNGRAHVELDPLFLETVTINPDHPMRVRITVYDAPSSAYPIRGLTGFEVLDPDGANAAFSWWVEARRKGYEDARLETADERRAEGR